MKFLIACSGKGDRWNNYMNSPKHLINVNGEILLHRTVRMIKERQSNNDTIHIVAFDNIYSIFGTHLIIPKYSTVEEKNMHYNYPFIYVSKNMWSTDSNTIILFGDVYFTDFAMDTIFSNINKSHQYLFFGRENASQFTGCQYGELFGMSFNFDFVNTLWENVIEIKNLYDKKLISRFIHWELYRKLESIPLKSHKIKNNFVEINDFTDDFDFPHDYDKWKKHWDDAKI